MTYVAIDLDVDDLVRRYLDGETPTEISLTVPASAETIRRRLAARGVLRTVAEATSLWFQRPEAIAQARAAQKIGVTFIRRDDLDRSAIIRDYLSGDSLQTLSNRYGCAHTPISRILREEGITPRSRSEAGKVRVAQEDPEVKFFRAARLRAFGGQPQTDTSLARLAQSKHDRLSQNLGPDEECLFRALTEAGLQPLRQTPVGRYNLDLSVGKVAIESHAHAHGPHLDRAGLYRRVNYLTDRGWRMLYVWCNRGISSGDLEEVISLVKRLRRQPAIPGQYLVLRCEGNSRPRRGSNAYKGTYVVTTGGVHDTSSDDPRVRVYA